MAAVSLLTQLADTTGGTSATSPAFTPAASSLLVVLAQGVGTADTGPTVSASANGITFTKVFDVAWDVSADKATVWVANQFVPGSPASMTVSVTYPTDPTTGTFIFVLGVSGMSKLGALAVRQTAGTADNHAAGSTPSVTFSSACLTGNPTIGFAGNNSTAPIVTQPSGWTELADVSIATPTAGAHLVSRDSGFTGTAITWGSTMTRGGVMALELDAAAGAVVRSGSAEGTFLFARGTAAGNAPFIAPPAVEASYARDRRELKRDDARAFERTLTRSHAVRVRLSVLNLQAEHLHRLNVQMIDGQVNVDMDAEVSRSATLTLYDPDRNLNFDSDSPADGALYLDRMIRITYGVWVESLGAWVDERIFTGPIVKLDRDNDTISVECHGKEALARGSCWRPITIRKGKAKTSAIRTIMRERVGEHRFDIPDLNERLRGHMSLGRMTKIWPKVKKLAAGMDRQLYYDGEGILRLRKWPGNVSYTFDVDGLMSEPTLSYDTETIKNVVIVKGGQPKAKKEPKKPGDAARPNDPDTPQDEDDAVDEADKKPDIQWEKIAPRSHPLSPWRIGRDGGPMFLVATINDKQVRSKKQARRVAARKLDDLLEAALEVTFDSVPVPHLDPGDRVRVQTENWAASFRLTAFSIPLVIADGATMSVGYTKRVAVRRKRIRRRREK